MGLLGLIVIAGCVEPTQTLDADPTPTPSPTPTAIEPVATNATVDAAPEPRARTVEVRKTGSTWTVFCAGVGGLFHCQPLQEGSAVTDEFEYEGDPLWLNGTIEWDAATPI